MLHRLALAPSLRRGVVGLRMRRNIDDLPSGRQSRAMATIQLSPREQQLKSLLLDVAAFVDRAEDRAGAEPLVLRWAGGWVRDKLLGAESHDIDTAINSMTGFPFAEKMREFCVVSENAQKHGIQPDDIGSLHKVAANPDRSKHLETATVKIFGMDVDFVNLRKETYAADSRNPQMEFGTAEEDALRRDATVNALFYNLHTGEVEDFTGGLSDMKAKTIKTPLEPFQTFTDDPLRVLRLVRFASRLQFALGPDTEKVMGDGRVLDALKLKISRERVGIEVEKMLKGKHPRDSLLLIDRLGLYHAIFTNPGRPDMPKPDTTNWSRVYECLDALSNARTPGSLYDTLVRSDEASYMAWVLSAVAPWEQICDPAGKAGAKHVPLATQAVREGIKASNKICDLVTEAHRHQAEIAELKRAVCAGEAYVGERDRLGMAIREWDARASWLLQVLYALFAEMQSQGGGDADRDRILGQWQKFLDHLQEMDVMDAPHAKRLIDGRQLAAALGVKPGKWMAKALDVCMAWQLRNPGEADPAGAVEEVRRRREELGIGAG